MISGRKLHSKGTYKRRILHKSSLTNVHCNPEHVGPNHEKTE